MLTALLAAEVLRRGPPPDDEYAEALPELLRERAIASVDIALLRIGAELAGARTMLEAARVEELAAAVPEETAVGTAGASVAGDVQAAGASVARDSKRRRRELAGDVELYP